MVSYFRNLGYIYLVIQAKNIEVLKYLRVAADLSLSIGGHSLYNIPVGNNHHRFGPVLSSLGSGYRSTLWVHLS